MLKNLRVNIVTNMVTNMAQLCGNLGQNTLAYFELYLLEWFS